MKFYDHPTKANLKLKSFRNCGKLNVGANTRRGGRWHNSQYGGSQNTWVSDPAQLLSLSFPVWKAAASLPVSAPSSSEAEGEEEKALKPVKYHTLRMSIWKCKVQNCICYTKHTRHKMSQEWKNERNRNKQQNQLLKRKRIQKVFLDS